MACIIPTVEPPVNPWNAAYWTGVSSSGSGVATAAGLCFASLGSDTGGSIRFPSTMNGLSGLKPTWGRVSRAGVFPLAESLDHVGPMCRSALDAALMLGVIAGADPDDPTAAPQPVPDYAGSIDAGVKGKQLGVPKNLVGMDADSQRAFDGAAATLKSAGATLVDVALPAFDEATLRLGAVVRPRGGAGARGDLPVAARRLRSGPRRPDRSRPQPVRPRARQAAARARPLKGEIERLLASVDLLLMPVMGVATPVAGRP